MTDAIERLAVDWLLPAHADDASLIGDLTALINRAYAIGEEGMWHDDSPRTTAPDVADMVRLGQIAVAQRGRAVVGSVRVRQIESGVGELGMLAGDPKARGGGVGRALVDSAEQVCRERGWANLRLEVLTPRGAPHPWKQFLDRWYRGLGYRASHVGDFARDYPGHALRLAVPCDYVIYDKAIGPPGTGARSEAAARGTDR